VAWRKNNPGCPCCIEDCPETCFRVLGCCTPFEGATITVFETGDPGTTLESGTTDANGEWCVDLSSYTSLSLSVTISNVGDFDGITEVLLGSPCGRTYEYTLDPTPDTGGGTSGTLTVTLVDEDGFPVTSGTAYVVDPANPLSFVASASMGPGGVVTFTGLAVPDTYFFRGPNLQNFPQFTLECEGSADAKYADLGVGQEWTFVGIDCGEGAPRLCCPTCETTTLAESMCLTDPGGPESATGGFEAYCAEVDCAETEFTTMLLGTHYGSDCESVWNGGCNNASPYAECPRGDKTGPIGGLTAVAYNMFCTDAGLYLQVDRFLYCESTDAYGNPVRCGELCTLGGLPYPFGVKPVFKSSGLVAATSVTCSPFSATFDIPGYSINCYTKTGVIWVYSGTRSFAARTITVVEGPCS
jgi:hypothetical protein